MWNNEWKKGEDYPKWGDTDVYKKLYPGDIYYKMKHLVKHTCELLKQLRVDFTNLKWLKRSLIIFGMVGFVLASPVLSNTGTDRGLPISLLWH